MTKRYNCVGPCATACKPGAGTGAQDGTFDRIIVAAAEHAAREAGLPGRADRMIACRYCGAPTASSDGICRDCADAMREAGLPGRVDRMIACRSCGAPTANYDHICPDCAEALRVERAAALAELCRVHRVRRVEDLPVSVLEEMQAEWRRC